MQMSQGQLDTDRMRSAMIWTLTVVTSLFCALGQSQIASHFSIAQDAFHLGDQQIQLYSGRCLLTGSAD